jgi:hypothetical protein
VRAGAGAERVTVGRLRAGIAGCGTLWTGAKCRRTIRMIFRGAAGAVDGAISGVVDGCAVVEPDAPWLPASAAIMPSVADAVRPPVNARAAPA